MIISIVRLVALVQIDLTSPDLYWNFTFVGIWTAIEYNMAIVCGKTFNKCVSLFHYLLIRTQLVYRPFGQFCLWSLFGPPFEIITIRTKPTTDISPQSLPKGIEARRIIGATEIPQNRARVNVVLFLYLKEGLYQRLLRERRTHLYGRVILEKKSRCKEQNMQLKASTSVVT